MRICAGAFRTLIADVRDAVAPKHPSSACSAGSCPPPTTVIGTLLRDRS
jgi:hypothetical protein